MKSLVTDSMGSFPDLFSYQAAVLRRKSLVLEVKHRYTIKIYAHKFLTDVKKVFTQKFCPFPHLGRIETPNSILSLTLQLQL